MKQYIKYLTNISIGLFVAIYSVTQVNANTQVTALKLYDYAYGIDVTTNAKDPFYKFVIPNDVYLKAIKNDFNDLALFNDKGKLIPFAIYKNEKNKEVNTQYAFASYKLSQQQTKTDDDKYIVKYYTKDNKEYASIRYSTKNESDRTYEQYYAIKLKNATKSPINQLHFYPTTQDKAWLAKVEIELSQKDTSSTSTIDLKNNLIGLFVNNDEKVTYNTITLANDKQLKLTEDDTLYVKLTSKKQLPPDILKIEGSYLSNEIIESNIIEIPAKLTEVVDNNTAIYNFNIPINALSLKIQPTLKNSIYPVVAYYKSDKQEKHWQLINNIDRIYQLTIANEKKYSKFTLNNKKIQMIKLVTLRGSWKDQPPKITSEQTTSILVFNNQKNNNHFTLVWGNPKATNQTSNLDNILATYNQNKNKNSAQHQNITDNLEHIKLANVGNSFIINQNIIDNLQQVPQDKYEYSSYKYMTTLYYILTIIILSLVCYISLQIKQIKANRQI